jgi:iron uptake system EfeUOB component EfeO/EfeM
MRKFTSTVLAIGIGSLLILGGCSSKENKKVSTDLNKMLDTSEQLSKAINNGDQAKVKKVGPELEDEWASFEDDVKKDNKDLYEKVEKYLDPTIAGSEAPNLDKNALNKLNNQLKSALKELADKTK